MTYDLKPVEPLHWIY